ncbi:hypothetical protein QBZ16_000380 [Prototheca wickerhamii]|uniref:Uncharacterized protein n=1 Tax=Prototheca wickerhamii TaxID=3111 RepID=A0AAD9IPD5_PROWI|nr:hypothetical protein QBZ16_000380 [Prototheca wickerhamii]
MASAALRQGLRQLCKAGSQYQQKRFAGNLPVKPNKYIEDWATRRELIEQEFKWDAKTVSTVLAFGLVVPYTIYSVIVAEFEHVDDKAGRPKREVWGGSKA